MPFSHHSHSGQFCKHASGTLEEVVLEAIRQEFKVYCLTEHVPRYRVQDLYPEEEGIAPRELFGQFEAFLDEAHRLKNLYASQIRILVGAETEYICESDLDSLERLLIAEHDNKKHDDNEDDNKDESHRHGPGRPRHRIEFLVGSIHHVNGIPIDFDKATYEKALQSFDPTQSVSEQTDRLESTADSDSATDQLRLANFLKSYLDAQFRLFQRLRPEIIGHFDLCRLYTPDLDFRDFPEAWDKLDRNVRFVIEYGALFEFNAAAFRKGWVTAYPGREIVELILRRGGRFTLSDDSHGPHAVGLNYDRLYGYLKDLGIKKIWFLRESGKPNSVGRYVEAVRVDGAWWDDEFWRRRSS